MGGEKLEPKRFYMNIVEKWGKAFSLSWKLAMGKVFTRCSRERSLLLRFVFKRWLLENFMSADQIGMNSCLNCWRNLSSCSNQVAELLSLLPVNFINKRLIKSLWCTFSIIFTADAWLCWANYCNRGIKVPITDGKLGKKQWKREMNFFITTHHKKIVGDDAKEMMNRRLMFCAHVLMKPEKKFLLWEVFCYHHKLPLYFYLTTVKQKQEKHKIGTRLHMTWIKNWKS